MELSEISHKNVRAPQTRSAVSPPVFHDGPAFRKGGTGYLVFKRLFDICFSLVACAVLLLPTAAICVAIMAESPGGPFFLQERVGKNGRLIRIIKLRTMTADADSNPERYLNPEQLITWRREQKVDSDPRITRMGRFLRRSSLDEVPQLLNVLTGELSIIGPRPVTMDETYEFGQDRDEFLSCKPGITGWWQVTDRNESTWQTGRRQLCELFYVRHAGFELDLRVFARTFKVMFIEKNGM